jgi:methyl-accepting chemotaxis protein
MDNFFSGLLIAAIVFVVYIYKIRNNRLKKFTLFIFYTILIANLHGLAWVYFDELYIQIIVTLVALVLGSMTLSQALKLLSHFDRNLTRIVRGEKVDSHRSNDIKFFEDIEHQLADAIQQSVSFKAKNEETVQQLSSMSKELAVTIEEQSASMTEQSSALNETAATVQELGVTASQTTDKANLVAQSADKSMDISNRGHDAFNRSVESMFEIRSKVERIAVQILELSSHTQKIGSIINTVDEIAETTNLLALNASIEASKAGESGRGFQVVASEIRKLAEQSKRSVADIAAIISEIQNATNSTVMATEEGTKGVDIGVELINKAGSLMEESIASLEDNLNAAQQILAANKQQTIGIEQITQAITNVNIVIKQVSAGTAQTKEAVRTLNLITDELKKS